MLLTRDGESELIVAERSSAPLRQAAQAMHVALAAGGDAVRVDEGGGTLPDAPWFVREGARACAARALRDPDGALRGHVALVFRRAVPAAAAYGDALGILASYARRSVLGYRELRRRADDWRGLVTQYEALFHSAPVLINAFDSDGRCTCGTRSANAASAGRSPRSTARTIRWRCSIPIHRTGRGCAKAWTARRAARSASGTR